MLVLTFAAELVGFRHTPPSYTQHVDTLQYRSQTIISRANQLKVKNRHNIDIQVSTRGGTG
jgi:hypothetical protein